MLDTLAYTSTQSTQLPLPPHHQSPFFRTVDWGIQPKPPHMQAFQSGQRARDSQYPPQKLVSQWLASTTAAATSGLQTPPGEMNGGNVNAMLAPTYGGLYNHGTHSKPSNGQCQVSSGLYGDKSLASTGKLYHNKPLSNPSSPNQSRDPIGLYGNTSRRRSSSNENPIAPYLQIPSLINNSKGSLAEFAAQITCLFWFESSFTLHRVEESRETPEPTAPLVPEAKPSMGFRKWVTTILSTTQVTQNVILLALMFIYRLKKLNPTVKGKEGSEFRLLTVALMLGNKFLDDNTYTNKTWAEVSGISVQEIHIMEVEFLSNMKYTLYASEEEWIQWQRKLGKFWSYFDKATNALVEAKPLGLSKSVFYGPPMLPSPPASTQASPPFLNNQTPNGHVHPHPLSMPPYLAPSIPSPVVRMPEVDLRPTRKRSYDDSSQDMPSKRPARTIGLSNTPIRVTSSASSNYTTPRLPVPNLSITTSGHPSMFTGSYSAHLPLPTTRAMGSAYSGNHQLSQSGNLSNPSSQLSSTFSSLPPIESRRTTSFTVNSRTSSPTSSAFPHQSSQDLLSPSGYPVQRNSPYRPLRGVNTLLIPPPSASMHNPSQNMGFNNMHYQPLGRPLSEKKTGVVPYMQPEIWPHPHQHTHWPSLPLLQAQSNSRY